MSETTRVLLVEDHASIRQPMAFMFEREPDMTVVAEAGTLSEARRALEEVGVDVAVLDINLPDGKGVELIPDLHTRNPNAAAVILSAITDRLQYARAVEKGASAVFHKSAHFSEVIEAARRLDAGENLLSPREVAGMLDLASQEHERDRETQRMLESLTPREMEILKALADGLNDKEIGERLYISRATVRTHMVNVLAKLELRSRLQVLVFAVRYGLARID